ncbi:MAG: hypothetical protein IJQ62_02280 [Clostridia bacterium]|nr:hypothetical protein [Clostridia bacterium]
MKRRIIALLLAALLCCSDAVSALAAGAPAEYRRSGTRNYYFYGDQGYIVEYRYDVEDKARDQIAFHVDNFNQVLSGDDVDVYFYFVNNSRSIDFTRDLSGPNDVYTGLCESLTCVDHAACLNIDSFETYMRLFFQTDHHWNHIGTQQGYEEILRLLLGDEETPYQPAEEVVFDVLFNGSYALWTKTRDATQKFAVYRYELPEITVTANGRKKTIGRQKEYFEGKYPTGKIAAHYATYYGGDWGELVYDTGMEDKENLLIISNSYSHSVRELLAAHFHKTYVVDMREYENQTKKHLVIRQYLKEHDIDKVLLLGDISLFLYGNRLR